MPSLIEKARAIRNKALAVPSGKLTLAQFAESGRTVRLYSGVLGVELVFAADNALVLDTETRTVYRARELAVVWSEDGNISADGLRLLHKAKTLFEGEILAQENGEE